MGLERGDLQDVNNIIMQFVICFIPLSECTQLVFSVQIIPNIFPIDSKFT